MRASSSPAIQAEGLSKRFGDRKAVDGVDFTIPRGQIAVLLGRGGAGKSTLLGMLLGLILPSEGRGRLLGRKIQQLERPAEQIGAALGPRVHPARTVAGHLELLARTGGLPPRRVGEVLELVGLSAEAGSRAALLELGGRQRLALAGALLGNPAVLLLDEPDQGLDAPARRWLRELLETMAREGTAVLVACAELGEVAQAADRVLVLDRGRLAAKTTLEELLERTESGVVVRSPGAETLAVQLEATGLPVEQVSTEEVRTRDVPPHVVTKLAVEAGVPVSEVRRDTRDPVEAALAATEPDEAAAEEEPSGEAVRAGAAEAGETGARAPGPARDGGAESTLAGDSEAGEERELETALAAHARERAPSLLAVLGAAPGAGASTVAVLFAEVLAAHAECTVLVLGLGRDRGRLLLPVAPERRSPYTLEHLLRDLPGFDQTALIRPYVSEARSGWHVVAGPESETVLEGLDPELLEDLLRFARRFYDLVLLDVGALPQRALEQAIRAVDRVVVVGAGDPTAALEAPAPGLLAVEALRPEPATVILNQMLAQEAREGAADGVIPEDRELVRALDSGAFELGQAAPGTRRAVKRAALLTLRGPHD